MAAAGVRNRLCFFTDAVGWPLGQSFLSATTILPMFVARLAGSNLLVGLVSGIQSAGQLLPQLFSSHLVERLPVTRRYVVTVGVVVERLPLLALAAAILLGAHSATLLAVFFACWALVNFGTGLNMPAFNTLFAKSVPAGERAGLVGAGNAAGTLLASGGALAARALLRSGRLEGYGWCFLIGAGVLLVTVIPLGLVREPRDAAAEPRSLAGHLRGIPGMLRSDPRFAVYVAMQAALQFCPAAIGFVAGYAVLELRAAEGLIALGLALMLGAEALGSLVLGVVADRRGCRPVFVVAASCGTLLYGAMALSPPIGLVLGAYALYGLLLSALAVGSTMTMELAPPRRTATFSAVVFSAMAPVRVAGPIALGALADVSGTGPVFAIAAAASALGLYLAAARLPDPRRPVAVG